MGIIISSVQLRLNHRKPGKKIGEVFCKLVRVGRILRCEKSNVKGCFLKPCRGADNTKIDVIDRKSKMENYPQDDSVEEEEDEIEWSDVSSAIDFFSFWILLSVQIIVTVVIFSYASSN